MKVENLNRIEVHLKMKEQMDSGMIASAEMLLLYCAIMFKKELRNKVNTTNTLPKNDLCMIYAIFYNQEQSNFKTG